MKTNIFWMAAVVLVGALGYLFGQNIGVERGKKLSGDSINSYIDSFEECQDAAGTILESYPAQCSVNGKTFAEDIGNELEKSDLIKIESPRPNATITSPLTIKGQARGSWFFEASFPVQLYDDNDKLIVSTPATTSAEWMTEDFIDYLVTLKFTKPSTKTGYLLLKKDNPSGLVENDDFLKVPVKF